MPLPKSPPARVPPCGNHRGQVLLGALFWILGALLLVLPFLRERSTTNWGASDPRRNPDTDLPFADDVANFDQEFAADLGGSLVGLVRESSEELFGETSLVLAASGLVEVERLASGERAYLAQCAGCHGLTGDGAGPAAQHLAPRPRNFRKGLFKFRSTRTGERPVRNDFFRTITAGLSGSAMPPFRLLPEALRWDIAEYARWLAIRGEFEQMMLDLAWSEEELPAPAEIAGIVADRWDERVLRTVFPSVPEPPRDQASADRGRALFLDPQRGTCFTCHGESGQGDGANAAAYQDDWGYPIRPRDFTQGVFRAGSQPQDIYQSIATGIGGTPMASFETVLEPGEIWDLVHYVQHLAAGEKKAN